ncbi:oligosaccharyl transferase, STT3 subunit [Thermococcus sp. M39]|uniref:STT3 domain-containing protein n=1 Tax=Thermococcus sp. M39 TaxID=1638262 RepID=UPI0014387EF4|nr:oligosaccharyl transferase, STT3 subunit [Thermococcus sp. M39]
MVNKSMKINSFKPKYRLAIILSLGFFYRIYPFFIQKYLFGFDPYVHLSVIREILKETIQNNTYSLSNAPYGAKIIEPLGLYYIPIAIYKFSSIFGASLYDSFRIIPVIFGVLTVLFLYLTVLNVYGKKEAFFSALFLALMWGHIHRSMANYYRGDNYVLFLFSITLFLLSLIFKSREKSGKFYGYPLVIGLILGLAAFFWWGYSVLFIFTLGISIMLAIKGFLTEKKEDFIVSLLLLGSILIGSVIAKLISGPHWSAFYTNFPIIFLKYFLFPSILAVLALFLLLKLELDSKQKVIILSFLSLFGIIVGTKFFGKELNVFLEGFGYLSKEGLYGTIMELQRPGFSDLWSAFSLALIISPLYALKLQKKDNFALISLGWIVPSLYLLSNAVRFMFLSSLALAFMGGLGLAELINLIEEKTSKKQVISFFLILLIFSSMGYLSFNSVRNTKPFMNKYWENALLYLKDNSNENDVVLTWWDYGGFVQYYAERPTISDSVYGQGNAWYVAKYYLGLLPEEELQKRNVKYVIVNLDLINKFGAILETANVKSEDYFIILLPLKSSVGALLFSRAEYNILAKPGERWEVKVTTPRLVFTPNEVWIERGKEITKVKLKESVMQTNAIVYINLNYGYAVLMNEKAFNTTLAKLMFTNESTPVYSDGGILKIFKVSSGEK